jgi:hypothetical protein
MNCFVGKMSLLIVFACKYEMDSAKNEFMGAFKVYVF